jgi:hypothetical protein
MNAALVNGATNGMHSHTILFSKVWAHIESSVHQLCRSGYFTPLSLTTMSSSQYPVPPPSYVPSGSSSKPVRFPEDDVSSPLLGRSRSPGGGIYDQPQQGDLPDDFKVFLPRNYMVYDSSDTLFGSTALPSPRVLRKFEAPLFARFTLFYVRGCISPAVNLLIKLPAAVCQIVRGGSYWFPSIYSRSPPARHLCCRWRNFPVI